jgi:hypothetical protein
MRLATGFLLAFTAATAATAAAQSPAAEMFRGDPAHTGYLAAGGRAVRIGIPPLIAGTPDPSMVQFAAEYRPWP